jgi:hypothetical protein
MRHGLPGTVGRVDEDQKVLDRLRRIDLLESERAPAQAILAEVRELLVEAEAWLRTSPAGAERAEQAVAACREALEQPATVAA